MNGQAMAFRLQFGETFPLLSVERRTRDVLASYVAFKWPAGRRKAVMREWDLSEDEARSVCAGRASWGTFDKIISHKRGGWAVLFPVFATLLDETAEHFIIEQRKAHADHAQRLGALVGDYWPLGPDRRAHHTDDASALGERGWAVGDRRAQRKG